MYRSTDWTMATMARILPHIATGMATLRSVPVDDGNDFRCLSILILIIIIIITASLYAFD